MSGSRLPPGAARVLRSVQKDDEYQKLVLSQCNELFQRIFGLQKWLKLRREFEVFSNASYSAVTTLAGLQTLGEEYVDIVQVQGDRLRVPSMVRRLCMVALQTSTPYVLDRSTTVLTKLVEDTDKRLWPEALNETRRRHLLLDALTNYQQIVRFLNRCNLLLFYFFGTYYHVSKRLLGVKYTSLYMWMGNKTSQWLYKLVGYFTLLQLISSILLQYYSRSITSEQIPAISSQTISDEAVCSHQKCSLCLCKRVNSTAAPCGHLFCWYCICEWIQIKGECPLCRESIKPFQLICLQNYP